MARRSGITQKQLREILDKPFYQKDPRGKESKARVQDELAGRSNTLTERGRQHPLERKAQNQNGFLHIPGPLHCRIIREYGPRGKVYDDDNLSGGAKSLRDSIAAALGLQGDSEDDGITFSYEQRKAPYNVPGTVIELYQIEE